MHDSTYRGRFAPSPTGPLHFGSLVAAVGSYLDARARGGKWFVRMEDLDGPREAPGAAKAILRTLEAYGFEWNGKVVFQSRRSAVYSAALARLEHEKAVFRCACTRREISDSTMRFSDRTAIGDREAPLSPRGRGAGGEGRMPETVYPGTCRGGLPPGRAARAMRVRVGNEVIAFDDALQGRIEQNLAREVGDFIVRRADGLFAYQLAVVMDDFEQDITDVVRGADLLASTTRQVLLQRLLGCPTPRYMHLPVAVNRNGEKLSKQTLARPLALEDAPAQLVRALRFLGQKPPAYLAAGGLPEIWGWALQSWRTDTIPRQRSLPEPEAR